MELWVVALIVVVVGSYVASVVNGKKREKERVRCLRMYSYLFLAQRTCTLKYFAAKDRGRLRAECPEVEEADIDRLLLDLDMQATALALNAEMVFRALFKNEIEGPWGTPVLMESWDRRSVLQTMRKLYRQDAEIVDPEAEVEDDFVVGMLRIAMGRMSESKG